MHPSTPLLYSGSVNRSFRLLNQINTKMDDCTKTLDRIIHLLESHVGRAHGHSSASNGGGSLSRSKVFSFKRPPASPSSSRVSKMPSKVSGLSRKISFAPKRIDEPLQPHSTTRHEVSNFPKAFSRLPPSRLQRPLLSPRETGMLSPFARNPILGSPRLSRDELYRYSSAEDDKSPSGSTPFSKAPTYMATAGKVAKWIWEKKYWMALVSALGAHALFALPALNQKINEYHLKRLSQPKLPDFPPYEWRDSDDLFVEQPIEEDVLFQISSLSEPMPQGIQSTCDFWESAWTGDATLRGRQFFSDNNPKISEFFSEQKEACRENLDPSFCDAMMGHTSHVIDRIRGNFLPMNILVQEQGLYCRSQGLDYCIPYPDVFLD